ncbi:MAG: signal peptidase I [Rickettsiales bacterium]|nr:signal peptidase I [Rickettsiales bacterium]
MLERIFKIFRKIFTMFIIFVKNLLVFTKKIIFTDDKDSEGGILTTLKNLFVALVIALIIRSFLYEPFHIPSGSMKPTLVDGDFIFVSKYDVGYSKYSFPLGLPLFNGRIFFNKDNLKRGDVIVFRLPKNPSINYIKRLIGLPGDKIQMKEGVLYINDKMVKKVYIKQTLEYNDISSSTLKEYKETLDNGKSYPILDRIPNGNGDNTSVFMVPDGYYFFMGDNRDNSVDSRFIETGFVPEENLVGKARVIFFSANDSLLKFWKWGHILRNERIFTKIK